ncbi:hypothetical protein ABEB36_013818 [Hypothenemus hampei]|uniref:Uncharacterized protein n=1 Tax=Hypothenemus hampei TaxID=57062 RepID=A0ABD1E5Q7_HYPHA
MLPHRFRVSFFWLAIILTTWRSLHGLQKSSLYENHLHSFNSFKVSPRSCYECNSVPWTPIVGRSLNFPPSSNRHVGGHVQQPPIDQYGAPQKPFTYPQAGQLVDFMLPPPPLRHGGLFQNMQPPANLPLENNYLPSARPSDSYGKPITSNYLDPLPSASGDGNEGLESLIKQGLLTDVQVVPSLRIADYTASIEHPVNLVQSPILDLNIKEREGEEKLSDKPIVVEDSFTSATDLNVTTYPEAVNLDKRPNDKFLESQDGVLDITDQLIQKLIAEHHIIEDPKSQIVNIHKIPASAEVPVVMTPPKPLDGVRTTSPKKLQIIVPYYHQLSKAVYNKEYTTLAPVFIPPPVTTQSSDLWTRLVDDIRFAEDKHEAAKGFEMSTKKSVFVVPQNLEASLQKNIDDWTQQVYSKGTRFLQVKNIPPEYFNTMSKSTEVDHYEASGSNNKEAFIAENLVESESEATTILPSWDDHKVTLKNSTFEKVYVVTPQSYVKIKPTKTPTRGFSMAPKVRNGKINNEIKMTRINIRVEPPSGNQDAKGAMKVIYSEWPHIINDLQTTTSTTPKPTSRHPLFGLMDLVPYTAPVQTLGGHSKVTSVGTSPYAKSTTVISTTMLPNVNQTAKA